MADSSFQVVRFQICVSEANHTLVTVLLSCPSPQTLKEVTSRRLDDRIRELCAKAASSPSPEVEFVLKELKAALAEHTKRLRKLAARKLAGNDGWTEKRSSAG